MVLRHSLPVVGVAAFGWSGVTIAIFFVLESWLFLTTRSAVEMTFGPGYAFDRATRTRRQTFIALALNVTLAALLLGLLVFAFGGFVVLVAFAGDEGARFLREGRAQTSFLLGLLGLLASVVHDGVAFAQRLGDRTAQQQEDDDAQIRVMFYRNTGLLLAGTVVIAVASAFYTGTLAVVVAISAALIWADLESSRALGGRVRC